MTILESLRKRFSGETASDPGPDPLDLLLDHELFVSAADVRSQGQEAGAPGDDEARRLQREHRQRERLATLAKRHDPSS